MAICTRDTLKNTLYQLHQETLVRSIKIRPFVHGIHTLKNTLYQSHQETLKFSRKVLIFTNLVNFHVKSITVHGTTVNLLIL